MKFRVSISRKESIADPEGAAVFRALRELGYSETAGVRFGRTVDIDVDIDDEASAHARVSEMCMRLLANPVIEEFTVERIQ